MSATAPTHTTKITPVILCGGSGTRLWPKSRQAKPKPFIPLIGKTTLFQETLSRCNDPARFAPPIVVTGADHASHVEAQLRASSEARLIVEPAAKNTAPAIALAALRLPEDAVMLVCPSDHHIADPDAFAEAAMTAAALAQDDWLVSFGIAATAPETGYGYLRRGEPIGDGAYRTAKFVEKPDLERAQQFVADGGYAWNGGIFAFRAGAFVEELGRYRPEMLAAVRDAVTGGSERARTFHPAASPFAKIEGDSIDYAVMEKTSRAAMVPVDMGWSDIGSWPALRDVLDGDAQGNVASASAELVDCRNVMAVSDGPRISAIGLEDVIVVVDGDEVLVTTADGAQKVGKLSGAASQ